MYSQSIQNCRSDARMMRQGFSQGWAKGAMHGIQCEVLLVMHGARHGSAGKRGCLHPSAYLQDHLSSAGMPELGVGACRQIEPAQSMTASRTQSEKMAHWQVNRRKLVSPCVQAPGAYSARESSVPL